MADTVEQIKFSDDLFTTYDSEVGKVKGSLTIDFTTNTILSAYVGLTDPTLGLSLNKNGLSLSEDTQTGSYQITASRSRGEFQTGPAYNAVLRFTGISPKYFDDVSISVSNVTGYLGPHRTQIGKFYSGSTDDAHPGERAVTTTALPSVAFDQSTAGFKSGVSPVMTGTVAGPVRSVEVYDGDTDLGAATVTGTAWTFTDNLGSGDYANLTAVASTASGKTASASAPYELVTGISGEPYRALEYDAAPDNTFSYTEYSNVGKPLVTAVINGDGTHTITASADGQDLYSAYNDTMTGSGSGERFVFLPGFGRDVVTDFDVAGPGHDVVDLSSTGLGTLAKVLSATTMVDGNATIHVDKQDTITLDGVTKAQLKARPGDFVFA